MKPEKRTLEHLKACLLHEYYQKTLNSDRLIRYINGIEEWAIEYGKTLKGEKQWLPTELHLTLKQSTTNPSPKNNAYKHMRG